MFFSANLNYNFIFCPVSFDSSIIGNPKAQDYRLIIHNEKKLSHNKINSYYKMVQRTALFVV